MNITADVDWEIEAPRVTNDMNAKRFDQATAGDQPFGPEPDSPEMPAPETDGK